MSKLPDPFRDGMAAGWRVTDGLKALPNQITCDVAIVGSGAGAGVTAELLTRAGLDVVILEEGPLKTSKDFNQRESEAYADLYQESAARKNVELSITILQGRCVGGTTVINWTSSFRTPPSTLAYWQQHFKLSELTEAAMAPWFTQAEKRLNMHRWEMVPNENNELLRKGAQALGIKAEVIPRNVNGCWNLGSCGLGCPTNAKQSMLVTTLPAALAAGARLFHHTRVQRLEFEGGKVNALLCVATGRNAEAVEERSMRVVAKHVVVAGGSINSPALLLRSKTPDPHKLIGSRTFLHPVVMSGAVHDHKIEGWAGAPQSIYVDHFLHTQPVDGPMGYKLEATPVHPGLASVLLGGHGIRLAERMRDLPHTQISLALLRDGFHADSVGGTVGLNFDDSPKLSYPLTSYVLEGGRRALLSMTEIQFASGARKVLPFHQMAEPYATWKQAKEALERLPMQPYLLPFGSAHVMGGCRMAGDEALGVVRPDGRHWQVENLSVHDGSVFPTSIGANPQLSIYGVVNRFATGLAKSLTGKDVALA